MKLVGTATLESLSTRNDSTIKIVLGTQELGSDDAGRLFAFRNKYVKFLISDDNISALEEEVVSASQQTQSKQKTPSQKLRAVLFVYHKQSGMAESFEDYYASEINRITDHYKSKLQPV